MTKEVTERDLRKPEFRDADPADYEFRADGAIVRKDRWERGIRQIAGLICGSGQYAFEIDNLVESVEWLLEQVPTRRDPIDTMFEGCDDG